MTGTETAAEATTQKAGHKAGRGVLVFVLVVFLSLVGSALLLLDFVGDDAAHVRQTDLTDVETGPGSPLP